MFGLYCGVMLLVMFLVSKTGKPFPTWLLIVLASGFGIFVTIGIAIIVRHILQQK
jgi:CHASE1-domain containing sensor protein